MRLDYNSLNNRSFFINSRIPLHVSLLLIWVQRQIANTSYKINGIFWDYMSNFFFFLICTHCYLFTSSLSLFPLFETLSCSKQWPWHNKRPFPEMNVKLSLQWTTTFPYYISRSLPTSFQVKSSVLSVAIEAPIALRLRNLHQNSPLLPPCSATPNFAWCRF